MPVFRVHNAGQAVTSTSSGANADVIYTVPERFFAEVTYFNVSNSTGGALDVTLEVYDAQSTTYISLVNTYSISTKSGYDALNGGNIILLNPGDKIVASASASSGIEVFVSAKEYFTESTR